MYSGHSARKVRVSFFDGDITCTGTVRKISKDGSRALVCFDNGDVSWKEYFMIDFIED